SFDAENQNDVVFQSHTFTFQPNGNKQGVHQLAIELGKFNGTLSYPTTCVLNTDMEIVFQYNELMTKDHLLMVLQELVQSK
ncbi:MAG: thioredoxin, partial [Flavobacteriales bacterium]